MTRTTTQRSRVLLVSLLHCLSRSRSANEGPAPEKPERRPTREYTNRKADQEVFLGTEEQNEKNGKKFPRSQSHRSSEKTTKRGRSAKCTYTGVTGGKHFTHVMFLMRSPSFLSPFCFLLGKPVVACSLSPRSKREGSHIKGNIKQIENTSLPTSSPSEKDALLTVSGCRRNRLISDPCPCIG